MNFRRVLVVGKSTGVDSDVLLGFLVGRLKRALQYQLMLPVLL